MESRRFTVTFFLGVYNLPNHKDKQQVPCVFRFLKTREGDIPCTARASFSANYDLSNGDTLILELCSDHMPKAVRAGEICVARKRHETLKVLGVRFHEINASYKPHSESVVEEFPARDPARRPPTDS